MKSNLLVCLQQLPKTRFFFFFFGGSSLPKSNRLCYLFNYTFRRTFTLCWGFCFWIVKDQSFSHPCCCNSPQLAATVWLLESVPQKSPPPLKFALSLCVCYGLWHLFILWSLSMAIEPFSWFHRFSAVWVVVVVIPKWLFWWILELHNQNTLVAAPYQYIYSCRLLVQLLADTNQCCWQVQVLG
jgi:hypothetical protein